MNFLRNCLLIGALLCMSFVSLAQTSTQSQQMIAITPYVDSLPGVPVSALRPLNHKLTQMVAQNGFGSTSGQFVLTCNVLPISKEAIPTTPVQYSMELEVSLYLVNVAEEIIVAELPVTVKALESSENRAYAQAFNQINPRSTQIREFMADCRDKITEYYTLRMPSLVAQAESLASQDKYEEALAVLGAVPNSVPEYIRVMELSTSIHTKMLDRDAAVAINNAKGALAQRNYSAAFDYLCSVHPASTLSKQANSMINEVSNTIAAEERRNYEDAMRRAQEKKEWNEKMWNDEVELEKLRVETAAKTAVAQATIVAEKGKSGMLKRMKKWLLGKMN